MSDHQVEATRCPRCRAPPAEAAAFCEQCGARFRARLPPMPDDGWRLGQVLPGLRRAVAGRFDVFPLRRYACWAIGGPSQKGAGSWNRASSTPRPRMA